MDRIHTTTRSSSAGTEFQRSPFLQYGWLIYLALSIQILAFAMANQVEAGVTKVLIVTSYVVLIPALFTNLKRPGVVLIFVGVFLNFLVIVANGGSMPVDPNAYGVQAGGVQEGAAEYLPWSKGVLRPVEDAKLWILGDIFLSPRPIRAVYSLGDVLILTGMLIYLASLTGLGKRLKRSIS